MPDWIARGNFGANASPGAQIICVSNGTANETITDYRVDVSFVAGYVFTLPTTVPVTPADCIFAWQFVTHGTAATPVTPSNVATGPWVYAGNMPIRSHSISSSQVSSTQYALWYAASGGHYLWDPQLPAFAWDLYLNLYMNWFNVFGVTVPISGNFDLRYHGP